MKMIHGSLMRKGTGPFNLASNTTLAIINVMFKLLDI